VTHATAIIGAAFIFVIVFFLLGLVVTRAFDGQDRIMLPGMVIVFIVAFVAAASSYRATIKRAKRR
jgi:uncharacterized membrane protein